MKSIRKRRASRGAVPLQLAFHSALLPGECLRRQGARQLWWKLLHCIVLGHLCQPFRLSKIDLGNSLKVIARIQETPGGFWELPRMQPEMYPQLFIFRTYVIFHVYFLAGARAGIHELSSSAFFLKTHPFVSLFGREWSLLPKPSAPLQGSRKLALVIANYLWKRQSLQLPPDQSQDQWWWWKPNESRSWVFGLLMTAEMKRQQLKLALGMSIPVRISFWDTVIACTIDSSQALLGLPWNAPNNQFSFLFEVWPLIWPPPPLKEKKYSLEAHSHSSKSSQIHLLSLFLLLIAEWGLLELIFFSSWLIPLLVLNSCHTWAAQESTYETNQSAFLIVLPVTGLNCHLNFSMLISWAFGLWVSSSLQASYLPPARPSCELIGWSWDSLKLGVWLQMKKEEKE